MPSYHATTADLSLGGVQLELDAPIAVGDLIVIELDLGKPAGPIKCSAVVRWCQLGPAVRAGLAFEELPAEKKQILQNFLSRHQAQAQEIVAGNKAEPRNFSSTVGEGQTHIEEPMEASLLEAELSAKGLRLGLNVDESREDWSFPEAEILAFSRVPGKISVLRLTPSEGDRLLYEFFDSKENLLLAFHTPLNKTPTLVEEGSS